MKRSASSRRWEGEAVGLRAVVPFRVRLPGYDRTMPSEESADVPNERDENDGSEIADGSNYRVNGEPGSEVADGSNYREENADGSEIADGSNYQVQDEPGSTIADGSNYRDEP